jgi:hypothetical protein
MVWKETENDEQIKTEQVIKAVTDQKQVIKRWWPQWWWPSGGGDPELSIPAHASRNLASEGDKRNVTKQRFCFTNTNPIPNTNSNPNPCPNPNPNLTLLQVYF